MSTLKEAELRRTVIEQATDWYQRHREGVLSAADERAFTQWLRTSVQNTHEYLKIAEMWGELKDSMAPLRWTDAQLAKAMGSVPEAEVVQLSPLPTMSKRRRRSLSRIASLAASVLLVLTVPYYLAPVTLTGRPVVLRAPDNRPKIFTLDDGSVLTLNRDARVKVRYSARERDLELAEGQAFFNVAQEIHRPFRVTVGETEVVAVGTQFDIARGQAQDLTVTVIEGRVAVVPDAVRPGAAAVPLDAGQQLRVSGASTGAVLSADIRATTAWMRREVAFRGESMARVAEAFNAYLETPIRIEDPALRDMEISGVFDVYDANTFLDFLRQSGVAVSRTPQAIKVSAKK